MNLCARGIRRDRGEGEGEGLGANRLDTDWSHLHLPAPPLVCRIGRPAGDGWMGGNGGWMNSEVVTRWVEGGDGGGIILAHDMIMGSPLRDSFDRQTENGARGDRMVVVEEGGG